MSTPIKPRAFAHAPTLDDFYHFVEQNAPQAGDSLIVDSPEITRTGRPRIRAESPNGFWSRLFTVSEEEQGINRTAWHAFLTAIREVGDSTVSNARLERIARRYRVDFRALEQERRPLTAQHVEQYALSSAKVFVNDVRAIVGGEPYRLSQDTLGHYVRGMQNTGFIGRHLPPERIEGGPDTWGDLFWHRPLHLDRKRVCLSRMTENLRIPQEVAREHPYLIPDLPWVDRMAKVFSSMEMEVGELIPAPSHGGIDYYEVFDKIGTGDGLVAYALRAVAHNSELSPLLLFRPSQMAFVAEDAVETLFNDMEANIGETGYASARARFERLLTHEVQGPLFLNNRLLRVIAYSLGSTQAQRFLRDFWRYVGEAVLINGPSMDRTPARGFADEMNRENVFYGRAPLKLHIYRNRYDIADHAGEVHLGWGVHPTSPLQIELVEFQNAPRSSTLGSHSYRSLEPAHLPRMQSAEAIGFPHRYERRELDQQLDNFQRGPEIEWYERTRQFWGTQVLYTIVYGLYVFLKTLLAIFNIRLFRSSRT